jgi:hypothetical protein
MTFDEAFERLIGHEGGYVNHAMDGLQFANESSHKSRSRIRVRNAGCVGSGGASTGADGGINLCSTIKLSCVCMSRRRLHAARVCEGTVQRALHQRAQGPFSGCPCSGEEARGRLRRVRQTDGDEGWVGVVPAALSPSSLRGFERCCGGRVRREVRSLRQIVSSIGVRLPSSRRQDQIAQRDVPEQLTECARQGAIEVHPAMRELPSDGAPQ